MVMTTYNRLVNVFGSIEVRIDFRQVVPLFAPSDSGLSSRMRPPPTAAAAAAAAQPPPGLPMEWLAHQTTLVFSVANRQSPSKQRLSASIAADLIAEVCLQPHCFAQDGQIVSDWSLDTLSLELYSSSGHRNLYMLSVSCSRLQE